MLGNVCSCWSIHIWRWKSGFSKLSLVLQSSSVSTYYWDIFCLHWKRSHLLEISNFRSLDFMLSFFLILLLSANAELTDHEHKMWIWIYWMFYLICFGFMFRTTAKHYTRECRVYLVQPFRGKGSWNCSQEVSKIVTGKNICILLFPMVMIIWFKSFRLRDHVQGADNNPLLIFPEGTCVNNHYTVMFKKVQEQIFGGLLKFSLNFNFFISLMVQGAFELGCTVCPIAIKYNKIFVDAFWNSRK